MDLFEKGCCVRSDGPSDWGKIDHGELRTWHGAFSITLEDTSEMTARMGFEAWIGNARPVRDDTGQTRRMTQLVWELSRPRGS